MGNPTDELRARLNERGIEYETPTNTSTVAHIGDIKYRFLQYRRCGEPELDEKLDGKIFAETEWLTPEQAIAATVGADEDEADARDLMQAIRDDDGVRYSMDEVMDIMRKEVAATVQRSCASCPEMDNPDSYIVHLHRALEVADKGAGTCNGEIDSDYFECKLTTFKCHSCGWSGIVDNGYAGYSFDGTDMPRHCPNCGATLVSE